MDIVSQSAHLAGSKGCKEQRGSGVARSKMTLERHSRFQPCWLWRLSSDATLVDAGNAPDPNYSGIGGNNAVDDNNWEEADSGDLTAPDDGNTDKKAAVLAAAVADFDRIFVVDQRVALADDGGPVVAAHYRSRPLPAPYSTCGAPFAWMASGR